MMTRLMVQAGLHLSSMVEGRRREQWRGGAVSPPRRFPTEWSLDQGRSGGSRVRLVWLESPDGSVERERVDFAVERPFRLTMSMMMELP